MSQPQSKFSGALANIKAPKPNLRPVASPAASTAAATPNSATAPNALIAPERGRGRPLGKRSNPDFEPTTIIIRKKTKKKANRLLEDAEAGQDLSELIEQLLTEWITQQS